MDRNDLQLLYDIMVEDCHYTFRLSTTRERYIVDQKQMFSAVARHFGATYQEIGDFLLCGHSNVINSVKRTRDCMDVYPEVKKRFNRIKDEFEFRTKGVPLWVGD